MSYSSTEGIRYYGEEALARRASREAAMAEATTPGASQATGGGMGLFLPLALGGAALAVFLILKKRRS